MKKEIEEGQRLKQKHPRQPHVDCNKDVIILRIVEDY